jgi:hypothetical protein
MNFSQIRMILNHIIKDQNLINFVLASSTLLIALISIFQWHAIHGQLRVMTDADRPWVGAIRASAQPIGPDKDGVARLTITNAGRSPARIIRFLAAQRVFYEFPKDPPYDALSTPWSPSTAILLPNGTTPATVEFPFAHTDANTFQDILRNKAKFYIYGKVDYEDLRVNERHFTTICYYWTESKQNIAFIHCPEYNDGN